MLTRKDFHEIKNHLAVAMGMTEINITLMKKGGQVDLAKLQERCEKSLVALRQVLEVVDRGHIAVKAQEVLNNSTAQNNNEVKK